MSEAIIIIIIILQVCCNLKSVTTTLGLLFSWLHCTVVITLGNLLLFIIPRCACTARVTVVVLCVCMYVCMCVCVYVCPLIPAASHIGITKERYQQILWNTGIVLNFADFRKNASFKSYGVICLPRAAPAS